MKKVILPKQSYTAVKLSDVKWGEKCYGIKEKDIKGWVQPTEYNSKRCRFICAYNGVKRGNRWSFYEGIYNIYMKEWLEDGNAIYEFDNEKELFAWLSE